MCTFSTTKLRKSALILGIFWGHFHKVCLPGLLSFPWTLHATRVRMTLSLGATIHGQLSLSISASISRSQSPTTALLTLCSVFIVSNTSILLPLLATNPPLLSAQLGRTHVLVSEASWGRFRLVAAVPAKSNSGKVGKVLQRDWKFWFEIFVYLSKNILMSTKTNDNQWRARDFAAFSTREILNIQIAITKFEFQTPLAKRSRRASSQS